MAWQEIFYGVISPLFYWDLPTQRVYWLYLVSALILAGFAYHLVYRRRISQKPKSFFEFCFPRQIYSHKSAVTDYKFFVVNRIAFLFFIAPVILGSQFSSQAVGDLLAAISQRPDGFLWEAGWMGVVALTMGVILAHDFAIFFTHSLQHRIPILWEFHKVHHSAEVLTPITVYRMHPVDDLFTGSFVGLMTGAVYGVFSHIYVDVPHEFSVNGINIILFSFYLIGMNLRHSHIWLPYTGAWGHVFMSPAHHQIHHGAAPEFYDRNMGFIFAFWDWAAGTLYVPDSYQQIEFGLADGEAKEYQGVWQIYTLPFVKVFNRIRGTGLGQES